MNFKDYLISEGKELKQIISIEKDNANVLTDALDALKIEFNTSKDKEYGTTFIRYEFVATADVLKSIVGSRLSGNAEFYIAHVKR